MKNFATTLAVVVAALGFPLVAGAQDLPPADIEVPNEAPAPVEMPRNAVFNHNEVFIGYGALSTYDLFLATFKIITPIYTLGTYGERNMRFTGNLAVGYKYRFERVASLGVTYAYGGIRGDVYAGGELWGPSLSSHHSLAVECDFRYLTRRVVNLYSTVGLGAVYMQQTITPENSADRRQRWCMPLVDFHLSFIGVKIGGNHFGGFAELGVGYKGIFSFGAYARF